MTLPLSPHIPGKKNMKKILFGNEARLAIKTGIDKCCNSVKVSMGGYGKNVLIYNGSTSEIINDGVSIAKAIDVDNEIEQAGIQLAKQCAEMTNRSAGDGTTTTLVLLQSILDEILGDFSTENPREVRKRIFEEATKVLEKIERNEVKTKEDVFNLAKTSSLDENVAGIISDIYAALGKDAKVSIDEKEDDVLEYELVKGIQFESKRADRAIIGTHGKTVIENAHVAVLDPITNEAVQEEITKAVKEGSDKLVVIAKKFDRNMLLSFLKINNFSFFPVQYDEFRDIDDIREYIGGKTLDKVIITDNDTTLIGGKGNVEERVKKLREKREESESAYEKEKIDERIAGLVSGLAVIRVGKQTDVEREEIVLKIEDALNCVKSSYDEGYCKGGGIALKEAGNGGFYSAPYEQICKNAGVDELEIPDTVIDSYKSVKESLMNAISTATSLLTVESALVEMKEKEL